MRSLLFVAVLAALVLTGLAGTERSGGQSPPPAPGAEPARARIVPVVILKPGERKELFLSTACTVGLSRSGGLDVREIGAKGRPGLQSTRTWERDGVTVQIPDVQEAIKEAAAPPYAPLKNSGIEVFRVIVAAGANAKAGVYNLHLADYTCSGTCETDFRVLVLAPGPAAP